MTLDNRVQVLFPEVFFQLQDECSFHPHLQLLLAKYAASDWETKMVEIATYCGILLHGTYTQEDFEKIAGICIQKLKQRAMDEATKEYLQGGGRLNG
jgi:hypothetical protein